MRAGLYPFTLLALLGCLCATPKPSQAAFDLLGTVDGQGADPLVDSRPFSIFPDKAKFVAIIFQSDDYKGVVTLNVVCCTNTSGDIFSPMVSPSRLCGA
jgi:hypothetical protein